MTVRPVGSRPDQRNCALYRIMVLDPATNYTTVRLGYIGETARTAFTRFIEHLYEQPWADTIVGPPRVDPRMFVGKDAVLAAEKAAVEAELPLYNIEWNMGNPHRIPPWVMREQRQARDPQWVPEPKKGGPPRQRTTIPASVAPSALSRWWARRRWWVVGLTALWTALFVACCRLVLMVTDDASASTVGLSSAIGATTPFVLTAAEITRRRVRTWWRRVTRPKRRSRQYR